MMAVMASMSTLHCTTSMRSIKDVSGGGHLPSQCLAMYGVSSLMGGKENLSRSRALSGLPLRCGSWSR